MDFPRFKRRWHEQGFRADNGPGTVRVDGEDVVLPRIGRVVMTEHLRFAGSIREVTINRTAGTWFACFCVEDGQNAPLVKDRPNIGVDVGVGATAVCSDGTTVANPKALAMALRHLQRLDKAIARSRNVHGRNNHSNRREWLYARRRRRRRRHARAVNVRNDHHHKATTAIAESAGQVVVETLNVAGLCFLHPCDISCSFPTATAALSLGAGLSLIYLSEIPGPPHSWHLFVLQTQWTEKRGYFLDIISLPNSKLTIL